MHKNALFLKKRLKNSPQRWGLRPQNPVGLRRLWAPPKLILQTLKLILPSPVALIFFEGKK